MNRRLLQMLALMAALMLFAAACSGSGTDDEVETGDASEAPVDETTDEATDEPTDEGTEEEAAVEGDGDNSFSLYIGEPEALLPQNSNESEGNQVLSALYTNLVEYDPETSDPVNTVAESIETDDSTVFTITVADGWTFHNGDPITAQTFVDSWNFAGDPDAANANSFFFTDIVGSDDAGLHTGEGFEGIELIDEMTFQVTLKEAFSAWPIRLGYRAFSPIPTTCIDDPAACNEEPIGNGPYQMDGPWQHDERINVVRYEDYSGTPGIADAVEFRIFSEVNAAYADVEAGNLDIVAGVPGELVPQAQDSFGDRFLQNPISTFTYLGFPMYDENFGGDENLALRQAFSLAINREEITSTLLPQQFPADSLVSPVVPGYREGACEVCQHDPERAVELFEEAGGYDGTLTLWFNSGAGHELWMEAVANQLTNTLGISDIQFESREFADYLENFSDAQAFTGPFRLGWGMDYPSPQNYLEPLYFTEADSNSSGYSNPEFEDLVRQGNAAGDLDEGIALYNQAEDLVLADLPVIPMFFSNSAVVHSESVSNVINDTFDVIRVDLVEPA